MNNNLQVQEDGYFYFRFLTKEKLIDKVKYYIMMSYRDNEQQNPAGLNKQDWENYKKAIKLNELNPLLEAVKDTNLTLYRIKIVGELDSARLLKHIKQYAYMIFEHELKMRFLFDLVPDEWNDERKVKEEFYDYLLIESTSDFISMQDPNTFTAVPTVLLGAKQDPKRHIGYMFCAPSKILLNFCERISEEYDLTINDVPVIMQQPFIIKTELVNHLDRKSFKGFIKRRSDVLVSRLSKVINYSLEELIYEDDESSKGRFDEWIQGLSIDSYSSLIDNFNLDFYETAVTVPGY